MRVSVYTDGSCLQNPGPGGWAFLWVHPDGVDTMAADGVGTMAADGAKRKHITQCGGEYKTTNNRMELQAVIEALLFIPHEGIDIYTDSLWVMRCANGTWKRKANLDLWDKFDSIAKHKDLRWTWVRGHCGNIYNTQVDRLARQKAIEYQSLY